jgi:2-polyprenyl-6-methoxyphenol hydroxylase-like FAD-dependent oxidoreductase
VVGCGVAGLAAAVALDRKGCRVSLFDAFDRPRPVGSGLLIQPSGLAALRVLGLHEPVLERGARIDRLDGRDLAGRAIMDMRYATGRRHAFGLGVHRASLFEVLHERVLAAGLELRTGAAITDILHFDQPVLVDERGGEHGPFDLAVVADGSASRLRAKIRPGARAPVYPWGAVWTNAEDRQDRWAGRLHQRYDRASTMIGVLPVGRPPGATGNQVSFFWSLPTAEMEDFPAGFEAWRRTVLRLWPEVSDLVGQFRADGFSRATYRDVAFGRWHRGAVVMIGDAAHGTSPQLGQGANLALLDGVELAARVERPAQVAGYQFARRLQTSPYQVLSRLLTPLFQSRSRFWPWFRTFIFAPLSQAPGLRGHAARVLTGVFRLGPTPPDLRP